MNKNREFYEHIIGLFNKELGTHISLKRGVSNVVMPCVDIQEQSIRFNDRLETLMMLFNLFMNNKHTGGNAVHHFLLYHLAIQRNMYTKAEELLALLRADIEKLYDALEDKDAYNVLVMLQTTLAMCHEMSHVYYALHPDLRDNNVEEMRHRLVCYREQLNTDKPFAIKILHFLSKKIKNIQEHAFDEAIGSPDLLEELCCDEAAWNLVKNLIGSFDFDSDSISVVCAYVGLSFAFMEAKRTFENIYLNPGQDIRDRDLRFDTSRHFMQNYIVWDYMNEVSKETSKQFQSLINDFERMGRVLFMLTMRENIDHIGYIRMMPQEKYSLREVKRLDALFEEVETKIKGYSLSGQPD